MSVNVSVAVSAGFEKKASTRKSSLTDAAQRGAFPGILLRTPNQGLDVLVTIWWTLWLFFHQPIDKPPIKSVIRMPVTVSV